MESAKTNPPIDNNLTTNDDAVERRLDTTDSKIDEIKNQIENLKKEFNKVSIGVILKLVTIKFLPNSTSSNITEDLNALQTIP